jgi:hypothetical protein
MCPPLTVSESEMATALRIFEASVAVVESRPGAVVTEAAAVDALHPEGEVGG